MADPTANHASRLSRHLRGLAVACASGWGLLRRRGPSQVQFWFIALGVGTAAGFAAIGFRAGVEALQSLLYGTDDPAYLRTFASGMPWWWIVVLPALGGLVVGLVLHRFTPDGRVRSVAEVIEGAAHGRRAGGGARGPRLGAGLARHPLVGGLDGAGGGRWSTSPRCSPRASRR